MDVREKLKSKSLSELFMLIRNAHGAIALAASEEIERRLSAQHSVQADGACTCAKPYFLEYEDGEHCKVCGKPPRR